MEESIKRAAEQLLKAELKKDLQLIKGDELQGKVLADALDDALSRSLAVLQACEGKEGPQRSIRVILPEGAEDLMG